jgi:hypothetical protein
MKKLPLIMILCLPLLVSTADGDVIRTLRKESRSYKYLAPTPGELKIAERLFQHLLSGERNLARVIPLCREIDLDLILVKENGEDLLILMELESARRGRGFYVFRGSRSRPCMLQMPHAFHDLHTGAIGRRLFAENDIAVAAWNTVARFAMVARGTERADLAHLKASYLQALTAAFARIHPKGLVLQIHGFSKEKRITVEGALADIVVSNGTRTPDRWLKTRADCIGEQISIALAVYPRDITELGGTTNVQSALLRSLDHRGFVHVEMSFEVRRRLSRSQEDRRRFWRCFQERSR